jgi:hypothetical protein
MITPLATGSGVCVSTAPLKGVEILIMDQKTVDETKSTVVVPSVGIRNHTVTLKASAALTGNIYIETANQFDYTGQWNPQSIVNAADIPVVGVGAAGQLQLMYSNVTFGALRVRIETVIANGTLSASYLGN